MCFPESRLQSNADTAATNICVFPVPKGPRTRNGTLGSDDIILSSDTHCQVKILKLYLFLVCLDSFLLYTVARGSSLAIVYLLHQH